MCQQCSGDTFKKKKTLCNNDEIKVNSSNMGDLKQTKKMFVHSMCEEYQYVSL